MAETKICSHCGEKINSKSTRKFCGNCDTQEKRAEMDKNNTELFESKGLKYKCDYCNRKTFGKERI